MNWSSGCLLVWVDSGAPPSLLSLLSSSSCFDITHPDHKSQGQESLCVAWRWWPGHDSNTPRGPSHETVARPHERRFLRCCFSDVIKPPVEGPAQLVKTALFLQDSWMKKNALTFSKHPWLPYIGPEFSGLISWGLFFFLVCLDLCLHLVSEGQWWSLRHKGIRTLSKDGFSPGPLRGRHHSQWVRWVPTSS